MKILDLPVRARGAVSGMLDRMRLDDDAILGGVARDLGTRTGLDPAWFRIAFIVLAVFSGVGVPVYGGLWLILRGRRRSEFNPMVLSGAAVLIATGALLLAGGALVHIDLPWAIASIVAGVAFVLWRWRETDDATAARSDGI